MPAPLPQPDCEDAGRSAGRTSSEWLLWLGVAAAFSPTLIDAAGHFARESWPRYALVFPALAVLYAQRSERSAPRSDGTWWVAAGLAFEVVAAVAGSVRWARPGLALAAVGLCRRSGYTDWRLAVLIFLAVPVPAFLIKALLGAVPVVLLEASASLWQGFGAAIEARGLTLYAADGALLLRAERHAAALGVLWAGFGFTDGALAGRSWRRTLATSAALAICCVPVLALATFLATGSAAKGFLSLGAFLLHDFAWIASAGVGLVWLGVRWRRRNTENSQ